MATNQEEKVENQAKNLEKNKTKQDKIGKGKGKEREMREGFFILPLQTCTV